MSKLIDFSGPRLKTERAKHHIEHLEAIFERYISHNKKALAPKYNRKPREPVGSGFHRHTPTILGDALHNLRAALDHAYCILVEAHTGTINEWSTFPIAKNTDWKSLKGSV